MDYPEKETLEVKNKSDEDVLCAGFLFPSHEARTVTTHGHWIAQLLACQDLHTTPVED